MWKKLPLLLAAGALLPVPVHAAKRPFELGYFLPKTRAGVKVADRLVSCPQGDAPPKFETTVVIASKTVPDSTGFIKVDARKGLIAKRTTELKLRPDGTLESFNATNEGQGGIIISALIKAGATLATGGIVRVAEAAPDIGFDCTEEVKETFAERERLREYILSLEAALTAPNAPGATISGELTTARAALEQINDRLTATAGSPPISPANGTHSGVLHVPAPDIGRFFDLSSPSAQAAFERYRENAVGQKGYGITWQADAKMVTALATGTTVPKTAVPGLLYRRPVPASIMVHPCRAAPVATDVCPKDERTTLARNLETTGSAQFPQLSGLFSIPIGRGGLFGTEEAAAEFDAAGAPTRLKYGADPGAAAIAGVVDTARTTYASLESASAARQQAELDELKRRKEIRELENELSKPLD